MHSIRGILPLSLGSSRALFPMDLAVKRTLCRLQTMMCKSTSVSGYFLERNQNSMAICANRFPMKELHYGLIKIHGERGLHVTPTRFDIDTAGKLMGAGMAVIGLSGPGAGIGIVFGCLMLSYSRNPTLKNSLFTYAILGFALTEAMGLFCILMAFIILYAV